MFLDETFQGGTKTVGVYSKEEIQKYSMYYFS